MSNENQTPVFLLAQQMLEQLSNKGGSEKYLVNTAKRMHEANELGPDSITMGEMGIAKDIVIEAMKLARGKLPEIYLSITEMTAEGVANGTINEADALFRPELQGK